MPTKVLCDGQGNVLGDNERAERGAAAGQQHVTGSDSSARKDGDTGGGRGIGREEGIASQQATSVTGGGRPVATFVSPNARGNNSSSSSSSSNFGTVPYTISQALAEHLRRQSASAANNMQSGPIDIVASVLSVSVDLSDSTAELLIVDPSLRGGTCGRVRLRGSDAIRRFTACASSLSDGIGTRHVGGGITGTSGGFGGGGGGIGRGDVVRFNRISVSGDYRSDSDKRREEVEGADSNAKSGGGAAVATSSSALATVVCDLRHSWTDPEAGVPFARVGVASRPGVRGANGQDGGAGGGGDVVHHDALPDTVVTPSDLVRDLLRWFDNEFGSEGHQVPTSSIGTCKRRRLRDINGPNILSDVVVKVLSCDTSTVNPLPHNNKRRRMRYAATHPGASAGPCYYASLSDGPGDEDMMPLYDCRRFKSILDGAVRDASRVLVTRLLSRRINAASASAASANDGCGAVLVPTSESTVVLLGGDDETTRANMALPMNKGGTGALYASQTQQTQTQATQHSPAGLGRDIVPRSGYKCNSEAETRMVTSVLVDVFVDDLNVCLTDGGILSNAEKLVATVIDSSRRDVPPTYRAATLTLDCKVVPDSFIVKARSETMATLCGSCPAEDLTTKNGRADGNTLKRLAHDILRGLIYVNIPLRWTLKRDDITSSWTVMDVMLPEL